MRTFADAEAFAAYLQQEQGLIFDRLEQRKQRPHEHEAQSDWLVLNSANNQLSVTTWGAQYAPYNDVIAPGDYDGDGKYDWAVWREAEGKWYVRCSRDNSVRTVPHGQKGDTPVTAWPR